MILREIVNLIGFQLDASSLQAAEAKVNAALNRMQGFAKKATLFITAPFVAFAAGSLKFAGDQQELQNMFDQTFGNMSITMNEWAENYAKNLNRADYQTKEAAASFAAMFQGLKADEDIIVNKTQELVGLMDDFSSFRNIAPAEAMRRFVSGLSGSVEVFDRFGINLRTAAIESELAAMGINKTVKEASQLEKVMARANIIRKAMGRQGAIGDAVRTMWQFTNVMRSARDQIRAWFISFGKELIPMAEKVVGVFVRWSTTIRENLSPELRKTLLFVGGFLALTGPLVGALAGLIAIGLGVQKMFLMLSVAASKAGLSVLGLLGKFGLWGVLIMAILVGLTLLIEDVWKYIKGEKSLIGEILPPWKELGPKMFNFIKPFLDKIKKAFDGLTEYIRGNIEFLHGLFTENADMAEKGLEKMVKGYFKLLYHFYTAVLGLKLTLFKAIFNLIVKWVPILVKKLWSMLKTAYAAIKQSLTSWVMDIAISVFTKVTKWITKQWNKLLGKTNATITPKIIGEGEGADIRIPGGVLGAPELALAGGVGGTFERFNEPSFQRGTTINKSLSRRNLNQKFTVNNKVNITVPEGTSEKQAEMISEKVNTAVSEKLYQEMELMSQMNPEIE